MIGLQNFVTSLVGDCNLQQGTTALGRFHGTRRDLSHSLFIRTLTPEVRHLSYIPRNENIYGPVQNVEPLFGAI